MVAVGRFGVRAYDLADPVNPAFLSEVSSEDLKLAGDETGTFWQNEDMDVDQRLKLVFLARDPRAYAPGRLDVPAAPVTTRGDAGAR